MCERHGGRDNRSKNCWCDDCVPKVTAAAARQVAGNLDQISRDDSASESVHLALELLRGDGLVQDFVQGEFANLSHLLRHIADLLDEAERYAAGGGA